MWSSIASSRVWKQWNCSLLGEPLCQCGHHYHGLINEYLQHFDVVLILLILSACRQDRSFWDFVLLQDADPHTIREAWMSELVDYMCYFEIWWFWSKMSHSRNVEKCFVLQRQAYLRLVRNHHPDSRQRCSEGYEEFLGTEGWQTIGKTYKSAQSDVGLGRELKLCKKDVFSSAWKLSCYYQSPKSQVFECISLGWLHDSPCKMWLKSFDGLAVSQLFLWTLRFSRLSVPWQISNLGTSKWNTVSGCECFLLFCIHSMFGFWQTDLPWTSAWWRMSSGLTPDNLTTEEAYHHLTRQQGQGGQRNPRHQVPKTSQGQKFSENRGRDVWHIADSFWKGAAIKAAFLRQNSQSPLPT